MKKNVKLLAGIVFIIPLLIAVGCSSGPKTDAIGETETEQTEDAKVPEEIDIFLRAVQIDDVRHLEMYDSRNDDCPVIDGLFTEVNPKDIVYWKKASNSKIKEVTLIRLLTDDYTLYGNEVEKIEDKEGNELWWLEVPDFEVPDTIKYEIHFIAVSAKDTTIIDPYLKLPKQN